MGDGLPLRANLPYVASEKFARTCPMTCLIQDMPDEKMRELLLLADASQNG